MKKLHAALLLIFIIAGPAMGGEASVRVEEATARLVRFTVDAGTPDLSTVRLGDADWDVFILTGAGTASREGAPRLPLVTRLVAAPEGARVTARVRAANRQRLSNISVAPWSRPADRNGMGAGPVMADEGIYLSDAWWPPREIEVGRAAVVGGLRVVPVTFHPVRVKPASGEALYAKTAEIEILIDAPASTPASRRALSPAVMEAVRSLVLGATETGDAQGPGAYLFICEDSLCDAIRPLADWKTRKGFEVEVQPVSEVGHDAYAIRAFLSDRYFNGGTPLSYVLLVGDVETVPTLHGINGTPADHKYATVDGDDYFADFIIGRMSGKTAEEIGVQAAKTLAYEKSPTPPDAGWLVSSMNVSGSDFNDDDNALYCGRLSENYGFARADYFFQSMGANTLANATEAVNAGRGWISYFGHGSETAWTSINPEFGNTEVAALTNAGMTPVINSIACANGAFDKPADCFAETWMKHDAQTGAVLVFAAARNTPFFYTDALGRAVSKGYFESGLDAYGEAALYAKMAMYEQYPEAAGGETEEVMQHFHIFGDPELGVRGAAPITVDAFPPLLASPHEPAAVRLRVASRGEPLPGARVHLFNDAVDMFAKADDAGFASFDLADGVDAEGLTAVVWGRDILPAEFALAVQYIGSGIGDLTIDDDTENGADDDANVEDDADGGDDDITTGGSQAEKNSNEKSDAGSCGW